jgi:hypothetical protein
MQIDRLIQIDVINPTCCHFNIYKNIILNIYFKSNNIFINYLNYF